MNPKVKIQTPIHSWLSLSSGNSLSMYHEKFERRMRLYSHETWRHRAKSGDPLSLSQLDPGPVTERVTRARDKRVTVHDTLMTPVMQTDPFDQCRLIHCQYRKKETFLLLQSS